MALGCSEKGVIIAEAPDTPAPPHKLAQPRPGAGPARPHARPEDRPAVTPSGPGAQEYFFDDKLAHKMCMRTKTEPKTGTGKTTI